MIKLIHPRLKSNSSSIWRRYLRLDGVRAPSSSLTDQANVAFLNPIFSLSWWGWSTTARCVLILGSVGLTNASRSSAFWMKSLIRSSETLPSIMSVACHARRWRFSLKIEKPAILEKMVEAIPESSCALTTQMSVLTIKFFFHDESKCRVCHQHRECRDEHAEKKYYDGGFTNWWIELPDDTVEQFEELTNIISWQRP